MLLSKCVVCKKSRNGKNSNSKKSRFNKKQEANRLVSSLELKINLSKIPLLDDILLYQVG